MKIHFIGIGGIGVSALAKYYFEKGHEVSGSDFVSSEITEALKNKGVKIQIGKHKTENLPKDTNLIIYSPAVQSTNPELRQAHKLKATNHNIQIMSYPQALGELTKKYLTIAVSGTHGKSTTTAMLGLLLTKAGLNPTVIVGTKVKEFGNSNCRVGKSQYLVIEADEYFASFLNYWPKIIVLTNIEADHLDYYKNLRNIKKAFNKFIGHLPKDGVLITNKSVDKKAFLKLKKILKVPGEHNAYNASLALAVARVLKIPDKVSFKALAEYKGSWRRFEEKNLKLKSYNLKLISDYAHHPTEIRATLKAAREKFPKKKIWCIYQPHQYQRTYYLFNDFVKVFKYALRPLRQAQGKPLRQTQGKPIRDTQGEPLVDKLIITDIYNVAGREEKKIKEKVNSEKLIKAVNNSNIIYLPRRKIISFLKQNLSGKEIVIIMGAGDIYKLEKIR